jgi:hypothetical protein
MVTHSTFMSLIISDSSCAEKRKDVQDLEDYIDRVMLVILDKQPNLLENLSSLRSV